MSSDPGEEQLRGYQEGALRLAREQNLVVAGATGVGKTLIALCLLREMDYSNGKKAFFMATNRALADQQYHRVRALNEKTKLAVGREVDMWSKKDWQDLFAEHEIVVCTPAVLVNLLAKGSEYMSLSRINLLVLDECHHAKKGTKAPYVLLMSKYDPHAEPRPRVLGMTATPESSCAEVLHAKLHLLPLLDTLAYAALPKLLVVPCYRDDPLADLLAHGGPAQDILDRAVAKVPLLGMVRKEEGAGLCSTQRTLGPWAALMHLRMALEHYSSGVLVNSQHAQARKHERSTQQLITFLDHSLQSWLSAPPPSSPPPISSRLRELVAQLRSYKLAATAGSGATSSTAAGTSASASTSAGGSGGAGDGFRALVLVQQRSTCRLVAQYLNMLPLFSVGWFVGQASSKGWLGLGQGEGRDSAVEQLRRGDIQVLVGTNVLSEGIDLPDCGLVVVLDPIQHPRQLAQMRGRARRAGGHFVVLVNDSGGQDEVWDMERRAREFNDKDRLLAQAALQSEDRRHAARYPDLVYTLASTGAQLSLDNALPYLYQLHQATRECQSYDLGPVFEVEEVGGLMPQFRCILRLPPVFQVPPIHTQLYPRKDVCRAVAAFHACVALHKQGFIDDDLNPTRTTQQLQDYADYVPGFLLGGAEAQALQRQRIELTSGLSMDLGLPKILGPSPTSATIQVHLYAFKHAGSRVGLLTRAALPASWEWSGVLCPLPRPPPIPPSDLKALAHFQAVMLHHVIHGRRSLFRPPAADKDKDRDREGGEESMEEGGFTPNPSYLDYRHDPDVLVEGGLDKGYLLLPLTTHAQVDWSLVRVPLSSLPSPGLVCPSLWPRAGEAGWGDMLVLTQGVEGAAQPQLFQVDSLDTTTCLANALKDLHAKVMKVEERRSRGDKATATEAEEDGGGGGGGVEDSPQEPGPKRAREKGGVQHPVQPPPVLFPGNYGQRVWDSCDKTQPLLLARKLPDTAAVFRDTIRQDSQAEDSSGRAFYLVPQLCSLVLLPKQVWVWCQGALPLLWQLEVQWRAARLMQSVGYTSPPIPLHLVRAAVSKPDYEVLEVVGDAYLKWGYGHFVLSRKPIIDREGMLHDLRASLVCNRRLLHHALGKQLQGVINLHKATASNPFHLWGPSLTKPLSDLPDVHFKVVSDVVEALVGAYLIGGGPAAADALLAYLNLPRPCHCPSSRLTLPTPAGGGGQGQGARRWPLHQRLCDCWRPSSLGLPPASPSPSGAVLYRVREVEARLGYTFSNQWLAVAALTHPSYPKRQWPSSSSGRASAPVTVPDYQRLEFLGDSLLDYVIVVAGYFTQQEQGEGGEWDPEKFQHEKHELVSNDNLARVGVEWLQLHRHMHVGCVSLFRQLEAFNILPHTQRQLCSGPKALADVVEALIAAVFLDSNGDFALVQSLFVPRLRAQHDKHTAALQHAAAASEGGGEGEASSAKRRGPQPVTWRAEDAAALEVAFPGLAAHVQALIAGEEGQS